MPSRRLTWFQLFDVEAIHANNVGTILSGLVNMRTSMTNLLGEVRMEFSPEDILLDFQRSLFFLTILLFRARRPHCRHRPLLHCDLGQHDRGPSAGNEIAIIKSRGGSNLQVLGIYLSEGGLLGLLAVFRRAALGGGARPIHRPHLHLLGLCGPRVAADQLDHADLSICGRWPWRSLSWPCCSRPLPPPASASSPTSKTLPGPPAGPSCSASSSTSSWPALRATGYYLLREQRSLITLGEEGGVFSNPLLLVVPALFVFAAALFFLRILPIFIEILARVGGRIWGVSVFARPAPDWPDAGTVHAPGDAAHPHPCARYL